MSGPESGAAVARTASLERERPGLGPRGPGREPGARPPDAAPYACGAKRRRAGPLGPVREGLGEHVNLPLQGQCREQSRVGGAARTHC
jgi:hypothetical protein